MPTRFAIAHAPYPRQELQSAPSRTARAMRRELFRGMKGAAVVAMLLGLAPCAASATVLYKSVSPKGVVEFSDVPPSDRSVVVERRAVPTRTAAAAASDLPPREGNMEGLPYVIEDGGAALTRANAQLDLAEHALAEALRSLGSPLQDMRLKSHASAALNAARIDFFRRNVQAARQNLLNVLRAQATALPAVSPLASAVPPLASR